MIRKDRPKHEFRPANASASLLGLDKLAERGQEKAEMAPPRCKAAAQSPHGAEEEGRRAAQSRRQRRAIGAREDTPP